MWEKDSKNTFVRAEKNPLSRERYLLGRSLDNNMGDDSVWKGWTALIFCASCGIAEVDDIKLKDCSACDLVRYCSDDCQEIIHRITKRRAKKEQPNYVRNYYSNNQRVAISGTARSAHDPYAA